MNKTKRNKCKRARGGGDVIERFRPDDPPTIDPNFSSQESNKEKTTSGGPSVRPEREIAHPSAMSNRPV